MPPFNHLIGPTLLRTPDNAVDPHAAFPGLSTNLSSSRPAKPTECLGTLFGNRSYSSTGDDGMAMHLRLLIAVLTFLSAGPSFAAQVVITIDESSQRMTVNVGGQPQYVWPVSTGLSRYDTPDGIYTPFRMEEFHYSEEWDDAPMPHSIFFTRAGHAIHGTEHVDKLGQRASHGCVRLDPENATTLFALVQEVGMPNTTVIVAGRAKDNARTTASTNTAISKPGKKASKAAVALPPAKDLDMEVDEEMEIAVDEEMPSQAIRKRELWPYERQNGN